MTTLYKPVLIETAEQAEALPARTLISTGGFSGSWITLTYPEDAGWGAGDFPFRALVPIEARRIEPYDRVDATWGGSPDSPRAFRYVTPWESA